MTIRNLQDIVDLESTALADHHLPTSTYAALQQAAQTHAQATALSFFLDVKQLRRPWTWTYQQLFADVTRAANAFFSLGVGKDDVIAFVLPNLPETHFTIWGGEAAGIVMAINPLLEGAQIAELVRTARAKVLVTVAPTPNVDLWPKLKAQLSQMPDVQTIVWVNMVPYVGIKGVALRYLAMHEQHSVRNLHITDLRTLMKQQPDDHLISGRSIQATDLSSYFCTGGTTGLPKIAMRQHQNEVFDAWATNQLMTAGEAPRRRQIFCGLPLFHVNGQLVTGLMSWMRGDHVILGTPQGYRGERVIAEFWRIVAHYRINLFSGVPTLYAALMQHPTQGHDLSSLEYAICGAAPMPQELFRRFEEKTGVRILEGYGLTEGTCVSSLTPPHCPAKIGSIGLRLPWQAMKTVILDDDGRYVRDASVDETGVLVILGHNVFVGYLNPAHEQGLWVEIDQQRWMNTGDLGRQDAEGYFWLTGRKKELIIRGGHNIDPKSIEEPLHQHPAVALAAAVGMPDPYAGELPVAYVALKPHQQATEEELLAFLERNITERAAIPKHIRLIDQMPVTAVGKIYKPALYMREIEQIVRHEAEKSAFVPSQLQVMQDQKRGLVAHIAPFHQGLSERLGSYAFQVQWVD